MKESFIDGNDEFVLKKGYKQSTNESNNDKKSKRSIRPEEAFKNLTSSQKSLFKQKSLPCVSSTNGLTNISMVVLQKKKKCTSSIRLCNKIQ